MIIKNQVINIAPPPQPGEFQTKKPKPIFDQFPDPKGVKIEKTPLENIFITYLGNEDEILDITLCQKKIDESGKTYYLELITKNKYTTSKEDKIYVLKINTLLSLLSEINEIDIKTIIRNGYLTKDNIIDLHTFLNKDHFYTTKYYSRGDGPVYYDCPTFLERYKKQDCIIENDDENLSNLVIKLLTEDKITVLSGDTGIGKSTIIKKLNYFIKKEPNYFKNREIWKIDYNDLVKNIVTPKQLEDRIKNTLKFLSNQPDSILFIDDMDIKDERLLNYIRKYQNKNKTKIVLISNEKIDENDLDKNVFSTLTIKEQKEETQRKILKEKIKELKLNTNKNLNLNPEEEDELIGILLNSNKTNSLNNNYDKNPILPIRILENAFKVATAHHQSEVYLYNFYYAICLENIKLPKDSISKTINEIDTLSQKVEERKQQEKIKKPLKEKIKTLFKK